MSRIYDHPLFAGVPASTVDRLVQAIPRRNYKKGELVIRQGDAAEKVYLLIDGRVEIFSQSQEGDRTTIIFHKAPFLFGEMEMWQKQPYLANAEAIEPCDIIILDLKTYLRILHENHQVCINLIRVLSNLFCETAKDRRIEMFGNVEHLVAHTLCSLATLSGEEHEYGILLRQELNKTKLAEMVGVSRRSVIRAMESLEKENLVRADDRQLVIPSLAALRAKAWSMFMTQGN